MSAERQWPSSYVTRVGFGGVLHVRRLFFHIVILTAFQLHIIKCVSLAEQQGVQALTVLRYFVACQL